MPKTTYEPNDENKRMFGGIELDTIIDEYTPLTDDADSPNDAQPYGELVNNLGIEGPLPALIARAHRNRRERLSRFKNSCRIRGLNELMIYLRACTEAFERKKTLETDVLAALSRRCQGDFEVGVEALLAGFHSSVTEAMRDVLEIELLLGKFASDPSSAARWATLPQKERGLEFRVGKLRQEEADSRGLLVSELPGAGDYKTHSELLHVTPASLAFGKGVQLSFHPVHVDLQFWQMFFHGDRILERLEQTLGAFQISPLSEPHSLGTFRKCHAILQIIQGYFDRVGVSEEG